MISSTEVERLRELQEEASKIESILSKRVIDVFRRILSAVPKSISQCHVNNAELSELFIDEFSVEWSSMFRGEPDDWGTLTLPIDLLYSDKAVESYIAEVKQGYVDEGIAEKAQEQEKEELYDLYQRRLYDQLKEKYG